MCGPSDTERQGSRIPHLAKNQRIWGTPWFVAGEKTHVTVSPESWVLLAHIVRPQGRQGEVLADIFTDFPERFSQRNRLFLRPPAGGRLDEMREAKVESH